MTTTTYRSALYLRFVVMNPLSTEMEVEALSDALATFAARYETTGDMAHCHFAAKDSVLKV